MKKFNEFLAEKGISAEQLKEKKAEELAALYNEYNEKNREAINTAVEAKASKEDIQALKEELVKGQLEQVKNLNSVLKEHGVAIKKLAAGTKAAPSEKASIKSGLEGGLDSLKAMKEGAKHESLSIKAPADMLISTNVSGGNVPVEQRLEGLSAIPSRRVRLMDIVTRGTAESNVISWVSQANKDGAAGGTAEGVLKNQIDFDLVVNSESVKKRTAFIKVSTEMLDDISFMESEIRNELFREILKDVESQVYEGDGTGSNLNGIRTVSTAFAAGTFANSVDNANLVDVLRVAMNQIMIAEHEPANYILLHPSDVTALKLIKVTTTDKRYIDQLQLVGGQLSLDGVPIIESTLVTVGEYLVGNFAMATVYDKGEVSIEIGLSEDDFVKNLRTILVEWRGLVIVKDNDRTAFVAGVIATDAAVIDVTP